MAYEDVIESGGPGRTPRAVWWVAALAAAAALGIATVRAGDGDARPVASGSPSPSETASSPEPARVVRTFDSYVTPTPAPVRTVRAPLWTGPHDSLLVGAQGLLLRHSGNGAFPDEVDLGSPTPGLLQVKGGTVVTTGAYEADTVQAWFLPAGESNGSVVELGEGLAVAPALDPRSVWVLGVPDERNRVTVRRVDLRSGAVRERVALPGTRRLVAEVGNGFLLTPDETTPRFGVWDRRTNKVVRTFDGVVRAWTSRYVVDDRRGPTCPSLCVQVVDLVEGHTGLVESFDKAGATVALSPDGRWVVSFCEGEGLGTMRLCMVDPFGGESVVVVGDSEVSGGTPHLFAWSRDSRTLYVSIGDWQGGQVLRWRAGEDRVRVLLDEAAEAVSVE